MTDDDLDLMLRAARDDTAPLGQGLRARILADATTQTTPVPARERFLGWLGGFVGVPTAALLGLWIGIAQADVVLSYVPSTAVASADEVALLDDVFGAAWIEGETE